MIRDKLIPLLEQKFGVGSFTKGTNSKLIVSFPPAHDEVGELRILDDGNEIIVEIGEISHGHFGSMNETATQEEAEQEIAENVADFVEAVFKGKYILWRTKQRGAGGWKHVDYISDSDILSKFENDAIYFTWSGPLNTGKESAVP
jgi:hypothetical protein